MIAAGAPGGTDRYLVVRYSHVWLLIALVSMVPFSIDIKDAGVSANYLMALLLVFAPWGYRHSPEALALVLTMFLSYLLGIVLFSQLDTYFLTRQFLSLLAGLIPAMLLFVRIRVPFESIKTVIIIASLVYSAFTLKQLYAAAVDFSNIMALKGQTGSQRYGFILAIGLFFALERSGRSLLYQAITVVIAVGVALQLSRSAYLAVVVGGIAYVVAFYYAGRRRSQPFRWSRLALGLPIIAYLFYGHFDKISGLVVTMYNATFQGITDFVTGGAEFESSEGTRELLWRQSIDFVLSNNVLLGSGMAGLYLVVPEYLGEGASAHSQYVDVFLRTGAIGLAIYLFLWWRVLSRFFRISPATFAGLFAMFVYGFFHETTKLSQGAFVFFILLNIATDRDFLGRIALRGGSGGASGASRRLIT